MLRLAMATVVALVSVLLNGCGDEPGIRRAESELAEHYFEPLSGAGMRYTVEKTCNVDRAPVPGKWHLMVEIRVMTTPSQLATLLQNAGAVVRSDRRPMIVQQNPGRPETGWNGGLEAEGHGTLLGLTYNHVPVESVTTAVGWADACTTETG